MLTEVDILGYGSEEDSSRGSLAGSDDMASVAAIEASQLNLHDDDDDVDVDADDDASDDVIDDL